jgi:hypothetical protein
VNKFYLILFFVVIATQNLFFAEKPVLGKSVLRRLDTSAASHLRQHGFEIRSSVSSRSHMDLPNLVETRRHTFDEERSIDSSGSVSVFVENLKLIEDVVDKKKAIETSVLEKNCEDYVREVLYELIVGFDEESKVCHPAGLDGFANTQSWDLIIWLLNYYHPKIINSDGFSPEICLAVSLNVSVFGIELFLRYSRESVIPIDFEVIGVCSYKRCSILGVACKLYFDDFNDNELAYKQAVWDEFGQMFKYSEQLQRNSLISLETINLIVSTIEFHSRQKLLEGESSGAEESLRTLGLDSSKSALTSKNLHFVEETEFSLKRHSVWSGLGIAAMMASESRPSPRIIDVESVAGSGDQEENSGDQNIESYEEEVKRGQGSEKEDSVVPNPKVLCPEFSNENEKKKGCFSCLVQ